MFRVIFLAVILSVFVQAAFGVAATFQKKGLRLNSFDIVRKYGKLHALNYSPPVLNETQSSYFIFSMYTGNNKCSGDPMTGGTRFGSCVPGEGTESNPIISYVYSSPSETTDKFYFSMCQYNNNDCSGKAALCQAMEFPKQCLTADDSGASSIAFKLALDTATPWSVVGTSAGVISENFYSKDSCTSRGYAGDVFNVIPLNSCFGEDGSGPIQSQMFTFCGNGKLAVNQFTDSACTILANVFSAPFDDCYYSPSGAEYEVTTCV